MNAIEARELAIVIVETADSVGQPVADTTVVGRDADTGLFWVTDNG